MSDNQPRHASYNIRNTTGRPRHLPPKSVPVGDALAFSRRLLSDVYERLQAEGVDEVTLDSSFAAAFASVSEGATPTPVRTEYRRHEAGPPVGLWVPDLPRASLCPDPSSADTVAEFLDCLRNYRLWAGSPSFRVMSKNCERRFAPSTICVALGGDSLPGLEMVLVIVSACGGTEQHKHGFATAWRRLAIPSLPITAARDDSAETWKRTDLEDESLPEKLHGKLAQSNQILEAELRSKLNVEAGLAAILVRDEEFRFRHSNMADHLSDSSGEDEA